MNIEFLSESSISYGSKIVIVKFGQSRVSSHFGQLSPGGFQHPFALLIHIPKGFSSKMTLEVRGNSGFPKTFLKQKSVGC